LWLVVRTGAQEARRDGVHRDAELAKLMRQLAYKSELAVLGGRIGLDAGEARRQGGAAGDGEIRPFRRASFQA
jgi:hypothetical protein